MSKHILFVIPNIPFPLRSGGHIRDWNILLFLNSIGIKPHLVYFKAGEKYPLDDHSPLLEKCASVFYAGERGEDVDKSFMQKFLRKLSYLLPLGKKGFSKFNDSPVLFPFSYQYDAINAGEKILNYALKVKAEIVILRAFLCHDVELFHKHGIKVIANCPDYNTHLAKEMIGTQKIFVRKIGPWLNYIGVKKQEKKFLPLCDEIWVPTLEEQNLITRFVPANKVKLFPNLIDVESYPDYSEAETEEGSLLFVGNYDYSPNLNAAKILINEIFPGVKEKIPNAKLYLIGKGLPEEFKKEIDKNISIYSPGFVDDINIYFKKASIFVSPVYEGAGMLLKVVEALAMGKAVVGFKESFRGINSSEGDQVYSVAKSIYQFVNNITEIIIDERKKQKLQYNARRFAIQNLSINSLSVTFSHSIISNNLTGE